MDILPSQTGKYHRYDDVYRDSLLYLLSSPFTLSIPIIDPFHCSTMFIRQARMVSIYLIVDEKGDFKEENFQKAMGLLKDGEGSRVRRKGGTKGRGKSDRTREKVLSVVT